MNPDIPQVFKYALFISGRVIHVIADSLPKICGCHSFSANLSGWILKAKKEFWDDRQSWELGPGET